MNKFFLETVNGCRFFSDHYLKVRRYRESRGLTTMKDFMFPDNGRIIDHPLIDKEFEKKGKRYIVESVHKHWYMGWYELAVARQAGTKSHGTFMIKSYNCSYDVVLEAIEENDKEIKWLT